MITHLINNYNRLSLTPTRGKGAWLWDSTGKKYLDFGAGIAVCSLGHCPDVLQKTLRTQADALIHCSNLYHIPQQEALAELLAEKVVQHPGKCFFCNSGTEANEAALKLARRYGQLFPSATGEEKQEIITFEGAFHGRTFGALSATPQEKIRGGFGDLLPHFRFLPFNDVGALEAAVSNKTAAVILEPIMGESGILPASAGFLRAARDLTKKNEALLIFDEIQCGLGRTGTLCGWQALLEKEEKIYPDLITWAKGIGSGFPLGALWVSDRELPQNKHALNKLPDVLQAGTHGTTYGGSPLASAVGKAVLEEILAQDLAQNARERGEFLHTALSSEKLPILKEIRGKGLMLGMELEPRFFPNEKNPALLLLKSLMEKGLLLVPSGTHTLRLLPPLNLTQEEAEIGLGILKNVLRHFC